MSIRHTFGKTRLRGRIACCLAITCVATVIPGVALPELRPLVRDMLENLGAIDSIGQAVALDDFKQVTAEARDLQSRARVLKNLDLAELGFDKKHDSTWDGFLTNQERAASSMLAAAIEEDGDAVMRGVEDLFQNACLPCHTTFREPMQRLSGSVLFMTSFLSAWRDMNRGLSVRDFALVGRRARELQAIAKPLSWDPVIKSAFEIDSAADRKLFRQFLHQISVSSSRIEMAAQAEDAGKVAAASRQLWTDGCIACHQRFRD